MSDRIPNPSDYAAERCGHNFWPMECPYEFCGYRDTLVALRGLTDALKHPGGAHRVRSQHRVLWVENLGGREVRFAGRVHESLVDAAVEADNRRDHNREVMIESRPWIDAPWPRFWDTPEPREERC
jgi:hypothetical protein